MVKPFSPTELVARIGVALRKRKAPDDAASLGSFVRGDLLIESVEHRVTLADRSIRLTATEYHLLIELSINAGRVLSSDHLLQRVWGLKKPGDPRMVRTIVKNLRRKLGDDAKNPTYIITEPRVGYRMERARVPPSVATKARHRFGKDLEYPHRRAPTIRWREATTAKPGLVLTGRCLGRL